MGWCLIKLCSELGCEIVSVGVLGEFLREFLFCFFFCGFEGIFDGLVWV